MTETSQFSLFKDCLASQLLSKPDFSNAADDSELDEFASYLAEEAWPILPQSYQEATYEERDSIPSIDSISLDNVSPSFVDTFISYGLAPNADHDDAVKFLRKVIGEYIEQACAPPPIWKATRATECEICEREVALSYHHLIPRSTHAKVLRRGWHPESMLNKVAWLCRVATNEELAQHYHTVELLLEREDIQRWRAYAAKQKWRPRPKRH